MRTQLRDRLVTYRIALLGQRTSQRAHALGRPQSATRIAARLVDDERLKV
jgi:hypothetical protein